MNNYLDKIEIKLRFSNELMTWDARTVHGTFRVIPGNGGKWVEAISRKPISEYVQAYARNEGAVESRWNWQGSPQGHYNFV